MATENLPDYFTSRGLQHTSPERLNTSLRLVLDSMPTLLYGEAEAELTSEEQAILKEGGIDLDTDIVRDPLAETAVKYAAIIESSLSIKEAAASMGRAESHLRQMIARRTLYSLLLDNRRYIPAFQFTKTGALVQNIAKVNAVLRPDLHPVEVFEWYTEADPDLFVKDDEDQTVSPIIWLSNGYDFKPVVTLAKRL